MTEKPEAKDDQSADDESKETPPPEHQGHMPSL